MIASAPAPVIAQASPAPATPYPNPAITTAPGVQPIIIVDPRTLVTPQPRHTARPLHTKATPAPHRTRDPRAVPSAEVFDHLETRPKAR